MSMDLLGLATAAPSAGPVRLPGAGLPQGLMPGSEADGFAGIMAAEIDAAAPVPTGGVAVSLKAGGQPSTLAIASALAVKAPSATADGVIPPGETPLPSITAPTPGKEPAFGGVTPAGKERPSAVERDTPDNPASPRPAGDTAIDAGGEPVDDADAMPEAADRAAPADMPSFQAVSIAVPAPLPVPMPVVPETAVPVEAGKAIDAPAPSVPVTPGAMEPTGKTAQSEPAADAAAPASPAAPKERTPRTPVVTTDRANPQPSAKGAENPAQPSGAAQLPDEAAAGSRPPVRAGEATSLLHIARSVLPERGRGASFATVETGQGAAMASAGAVSVRLSAERATLTPIPVTQAPPGPAETPAVSGKAPVVMPEAPEAVEDKGGKPAAAVISVAVAKPTSEGRTTQMRPDDGRKGVPQVSAGKGVDTARSTEQADPAAATSSASSGSSAQPAFDLKTLGIGPSVAPPAPAAGLGGPQGAIGASLDQKVIDMGVSGQWIDDIARQIATISDNPGRGSFQIASPNLGAVRVDIMPGTGGSDIRLTAETEAAQVALVRDKGRLVQDAHLAAIRIGEVRIDRMAPASESQRGETGHEGRENANAQTGTAPNGGGQQGGQPGARQDGAAAFAGQYSGGNPKNPFTRTVIKDAGMTEAKGVPGEKRGDTARYA